MGLDRTSSSSRLPARWPSELQYLTALKYHSSVPAAVQSHIQPLTGRTTVVGGGNANRPPVTIRAIIDASHPAFGQLGLFAAKKIPPQTHIVDYMGEVHCDDRPKSDYDLSLYRTNDGLSVGVDANQMGNEARFINDFRGVRVKPNAVFEDHRTANGVYCMGVWSGREGIKKGEEILLSYGKGFWRARSGNVSDVGGGPDDDDDEVTDTGQTDTVG